MLISDKMVAAINKQIGNEFGAFLQYVAIAAYFGNESLPELSRHFNQQAMEEREHAMKFVNFVLDAGGLPEIPAIPAPQSRFSSAEEAVKLSLTWEETVTKQINGLLDQAGKENDHTSHTFLQWFVNEQLEEVSSMDMLLKIVRRAGTNLLFVEDYLARKGVKTLAPAAE
jgi:ferritin